MSNPLDTEGKGNPLSENNEVEQAIKRKYRRKKTDAYRNAQKNYDATRPRPVTVRFSDEVLEGIKKVARPNEDTPNKVVKRVVEEFVATNQDCGRF